MNLMHFCRNLDRIHCTNATVHTQFKLDMYQPKQGKGRNDRGSRWQD